MATRSRIGIELPDGRIKSIYCHWDGYISHTGKLLQGYYQDRSKIEQLMELGDISSLGAELGDKHSFTSPPEGVCNAYGRDRGEVDVEAKFFRNINDFMEHGEEYNYLFTIENGWIVGWNDSANQGRYTSLTSALDSDII